MAESRYDVVIRNGRIIDGTGNPWFRADVGIRKGRIAHIGSLKASQGRRTINAENNIIAPGFIDIHTHCDRLIADRPLVENYAHQGVSTVIGGNCGFQVFPLKKLFRRLRQDGMALNFGCLAGHNTIRKQVMELEDRAPRPKELREMKNLLKREMQTGAFGLSTGLIYLPGVFAATDEIIELAGAVAPFNGMYASHMRAEGLHVDRAIKEALSVGRAHGIRVQLSHVKLVGRKAWGRIEKIYKPIEQARKQGVEVTMDQYPYIASSTGLSNLFPAWAREGGSARMLERMQADRNFAERVKKEVVGKRLAPAKGGRKLAEVQVAAYPPDRRMEGRNLAAILRMQGTRATALNAFKLLVRMMESDTASGVFFGMHEPDVQTIMQSPLVMAGSDSGVQKKGKGVPHPRSYGTFPRILGRYVRELGILPLEPAIRKMTSMPARVLRLKDRGTIQTGMRADITVFDPEKVIDRATFEKPHQYPNGIDWLLVNGIPVIEKGRHTRKRPGMVLKPS